MEKLPRLCYRSLMIYEHTDFRSYLREELISGIKRNPRYSLRGFAKHLGVAPSTLSEILNGKKSISGVRVYEMAAALSLTDKQAAYFALMVDLDKVKSPDAKDLVLGKMRKINPQNPVRNLQLEAFKVMADWHHI